MTDVVVIGSLNIDLAVKVARFPAPGETLTGQDFKVIPGGKGANQAVAAARLGASVAMAGRVGDDVFGGALLDALRRSGVSTEHVAVTPGVPTGTALITVNLAAENSIVIVPGANGALSVSDVESLGDVIAGARLLLLQLEVPMETVIRAAQLARDRNVTVVLDPAPARALPSELLQLVDIITPNETEAAILTGRQVNDARTAKLAAADLLHQGAGAVIVKLGARGAVLAQGNRFEHLEGFPVEPVDTTAAGDAFAGGLATALAERELLRDAVIFANAVGALATTRFGAQTSAPSRSEVDELVRRRGDLR